MIENNEKIQNICSDIINEIRIIKIHLEYDEEIDYDYILEKINNTQCNLNVLIKMAKDKKKKKLSNEIVDGISF